MATRKLTPVRGKRIRVTRLGECGAAPEAAEEDAFVTSKGFVTVTLEAEIEEGEELQQRNADGELLVSIQNEHEFKRWMLMIELVDVDPDLVSLLTKVNLETDAEGDTVGFRTLEGRIEEQFAFELWTGVGEQACEQTGAEEFGYLLLPWVQGGTIGDFTVEDGVSTFSIENAFTRAGGLWGTGPFDVVPDEQGDPAQLSDPIAAGEHHLQRLTTIAPPEAVVGIQDMPAGP